MRVGVAVQRGGSGVGARRGGEDGEVDLQDQRRSEDARAPREPEEVGGGEWPWRVLGGSEGARRSGPPPVSGPTGSGRAAV